MPKKRKGKKELDREEHDSFEKRMERDANAKIYEL